MHTLDDADLKRPEQAADDASTLQGAARPDAFDAHPTNDALRQLLFDSPDAPPATLGRYRLDAVVGVGGMGVVFRGYDPALDRPVAIKLVRASVSRAESLAAEARAQASVEHPAVVPVHDLGRYGPGDVPRTATERWSIPAHGVYIVMRWVEGQTLAAWLRSRRPSRSELLSVFERIGAGLQHVHEQGLVHQDFKPSNVLIDAQQRPQVVDFGIAAAVVSGPTTSRLSSEVRGTPRYMAPEQADGDPADPRADQYAFALCLAEALTGDRVFPPDRAGRRGVGARGGPSNAAMARIPRWLRPVLRRALDPAPAGRFPSIAALLDTIIARRRRLRAGAGVLVASAAAVCIVAALPSSTQTDPCVAAGSPVAQRWDDAMATAVPEHAPSLDAFAVAWTDARHDACRALLQPGTQAAAEGRILCLDRLLTTFSASVAVLQEHPPEAEAADVVRALPSPSECGRKASGAAALLLPTDAPGESRAQAAVAALERATALGHAGRNEAQLAEAERAHDLALKVGHPPLTAATAQRLSWALWEMDRPEAALPIAKQALAAAERAGDLQRVLRIQVDLVGMLGASLRRYDEALGLALAVEARSEAMPDPRVFRASLHHNVGRTKLVRGDPEEALVDLRQALALRRALGDRGEALATNLSLVGSAYLRLGRVEQAAEAFDEALALRRELQGDAHPDVATALNNVGITAQRQGDLQRAQAAFAEAEATFVRTRGADSKDVGMVLNNLGVVEFVRGDVEASARTQRRALAAKRASVGAAHPDMGYSWTNLGRALRHQGEPGAAQQAFESAFENWRDTFGAGHPLLIEPLLGHAEVAADQGRADDAAQYLEQALALATDGRLDDPEQRARWLTTQARVAAATEAPQRAAEALAAWRTLPIGGPGRLAFEQWMLERGYPVPSEEAVRE